MRVLRPIFFVLLLLLLFSGCTNQNNEKASNNNLQIYTSIYPIQYVVEQIAGDEAIVESIYPPGVDAHTYEPSSKEITDLANGDAFIYLGAGMESFTETTAEALSSQNIRFIELGEHEDLFSDHNSKNQPENDSRDHGDVDPHIWLDPLRMIKIGEIITSELSELQPKNKTLFQKNFSLFEASMENLDQEFTKTLNNKQNKEIIVTHAAYGYWEERYGMKQIAISGISSSDEPSQKELTSIAKTAKEKGLQYVIFEANSSNRIATIIQEHIQAEKLYIYNLEVLTEEEIQNKEDYVSLMKKNLHVLDKATK